MPRPPSIPADERAWMTVPEVAEMFEKSPETIRNWIESGKLPAFKHNTYFRVLREDAEALALKMYGSIELPDLPE